MYSQIAANKRKTILMMLIFLVFIGGMGWLFSKFVGNPSITPYVIAGALGYALLSYYSSSKMALALNHAKQIQKRDNPRLYRVVENIAITEGLPTPKVYIIEDPAPNAFAAGRNPQHALVCATTGLLDMMNDKELEGVIAHELGHIKNYDIRVSMAAFALVAAISLLADIMLRFWWFSDDDSDSSIFFVIGIVGALLAPIIAVLIQMSISRKREYLADATGALATRYPEGLADALAKIKESGSALKKPNASTAHLFFANPLKGKSLTNLFSTHPPIDDRIKRLQEMETKV